MKQLISGFHCGEKAEFTWEQETVDAAPFLEYREHESVNILQEVRFRA